ncbi:MAG TPA: hypothetical protein VEL76_18950 [Gemmataceae bacterium]|nr:hypothetical protein [Gemmataceae bacterium]
MIVCLDTNVVIYLIEANPVWTPKATPGMLKGLKGAALTTAEGRPIIKPDQRAAS